jgi:hypothetical protein
MARESDHVVGTSANLHVLVENSTEDGACLTGHASEYRAWSCSYRWQAVKESRRSRQALYDKTPAVRPQDRQAGTLGTSAYRSNAGNLTPAHYAFRIRVPEHGDWFVGGPLRPGVKSANGKSIKVGKNFTKDTWPYWNNAHHLIPKALLMETIDAVEEADCRELIQLSLLRAKYNVNHYVNMILLPQDKEVGRALGLPRHLVLEDEPQGIDPTPKFDHVSYSNNVLMGLKVVILAYKKACDQELQRKCDTSEFKLSKAKLERLSRQCYAAVLGHGAANPGSPISAMPPIRFK